MCVRDELAAFNKLSGPNSYHSICKKNPTDLECFQMIKVDATLQLKWDYNYLGTSGHLR